MVLSKPDSKISYKVLICKRKIVIKGNGWNSVKTGILRFDPFRPSQPNQSNSTFLFFLVHSKQEVSLSGQENDQLKFSEWRPIGFVIKDEQINAVHGCFPGGFRENLQSWSEPQELEKDSPDPKLVERYALEVSRFSNLTKDMKKPGIVSIKLVGAVLGHEETPGLNLESKDGKVQLFQVEFEETAEPKKERVG